MFLILWLVPVAVLFLALGRANVFAQFAGFFSVMAVVTLGGAYAVLAYVAQEAVQNAGSLRARCWMVSVWQRPRPTEAC